ncbi:MAG: diaminopimelate epimerase, partial [Pseudomonas sp.]|nr:diaminopimelate epimerase [Pseudomonas sp.]
MTPFYDARGNIYAVVTPDEVRGRGIDLPDQARDAAQIREHWASAAIEA